ncbi:MAG: pyridoxal phosphate-dependent aminotransferase [Gammaproteobacteria bacterium]|nr:pyridoxal phosphate-dependent aminotransferase [Gammaproteobacteria bacterium]
MTDLDHLVRPAVAGVRLSAIKDMAIRSAAIEGAVSLSWGLPSFRTPAPIRAAVARELERDPDIGKYALPAGLAELRQAVVSSHAAKTGVTADADQNVLITAGNMEGISTLLRVLIDPGDEVILTDPGFVSHYNQVELRGGVPVPWPLDEARGWHLDPEALETLITPRTKAILLVTPSNPTGTIFQQDDLLTIARIARERDFLVILDDPYSHFLYENEADYSNLASQGDLFDNIAYLFTFSKAYAMSGWRLGYMIVPDGLRRQALKVHDATIICTPRISQVAGLAALTGDAAHLLEFEQTLAQRRELICERLDRLAHVFAYVRPQGAYYVFPQVLAEHDNAYDFAVTLLDEARVSVTPGAAFGPSGEHHVRMAFCVDEDTINAAFDRMDRYFGS